MFYKMMFVSFNRNMKDVTYGAGTVHPSGAPEFTLVFSGVHVDRSLVFCVMFCRSLFVLFLSAIVLSVLLRFMATD